MIGKPEWFTYRIFGWGIRPKTWQGGVYIAVWLLIWAVIATLPIPNQAKAWVLGVVIGVAVLDILHIMTKLNKVHDERENLHQLIIERNCSFAAIAALVVVAIFQTINNSGAAGIPFDTSIIVVLAAMLVAKVGTTAFVKMRL